MIPDPLGKDVPESAGRGCAPGARGLALWQWVVLLAVLVVPRVARFCSSRVWLEDTPYVYAGFLIAQGQRPHLDFVCPHFPVLESGLAAAYWLFGASHRTAEAITQIVTLLSCLLVFCLAKDIREHSEDKRARSRLGGFWAGIAAALLLGACSLTFRFHLFEREVFLCFLFLAAASGALRGAPWSVKWAMGIGAMLGLGIVIKLTFVLCTGIFVAFVILELGQRRMGLIIAAVAFGIWAALTLGYWCAYGDEFLFQVYAFHLLKGRSFMSLWARLHEVRLWGALPPAALAVSVLYANQLRGPCCRLAWAVLVVYSLFFLLLSPTVWAHNLLMLLPSMALLGGLGIKGWFGSVSQAGHSKVQAVRAVGGGVVFLVCALWITPWVNKNWREDGAWGFAGMERRDLARAAALIREHTGPDELVCAPPIVALEAQRRDPFHYRELLGVCRWARESIAESGWGVTRRIGREASFYLLEEECRRWWLPELFEAIRTRGFAAVVPETQSCHYDILRPETISHQLERYGYQPALKAGELSVWFPPGRMLLKRPQSPAP